MFELFNPHAKEVVQAPYVFQTEHPGLQKIYDAVVELEITEPVVPMLLPDGYELKDQRIYENLEFKSILAILGKETNEIIINIRTLGSFIPGQYEEMVQKLKK